MGSPVRNKSVECQTTPSKDLTAAGTRNALLSSQSAYWTPACKSLDLSPQLLVTPAALARLLDGARCKQPCTAHMYVSAIGGTYLGKQEVQLRCTGVGCETERSVRCATAG